MKASDNLNDEDAMITVDVVIYVALDSGPPAFPRPYSTNLNKNEPVNSSVTQVRASDADLVVWYHCIFKLSNPTNLPSIFDK